LKVKGFSAQRCEDAPMRSTAVEAATAALARLDGAVELGGVVDRNDADVLARAEAVDRAQLPWRGRVVTVKDWIDVEGFECEGESQEHIHRRPEHDATAVRRLRSAGAVVVAKTQPGVTHPLHGAVRHPTDPTRSPGGSSTGEAALIGAGVSTLGLGSDSGGSIRLPAAWCGIYGLKPSFGLVPTTGHFPRVGGRGDGRTVIGPMSIDVAGLVDALRVIAGPDHLDPFAAPVPFEDPEHVDIADLRVVIAEAESTFPVAASTTAAVMGTAARLAAAGATILEVPLPLDHARAMEITVGYWTRSEHSGAAAQRQLDEWDRYDRWLTRAAEPFDVLLMPVASDVAPPLRQVSPDDFAFTIPWSLTGWPAASVPMGQDAETGLPLAVQVVAPRWNDHVVLAVAAALESGRA
jgi:amidase